MSIMDGPVLIFRKENSMNIERWTSGYKVTATDWYDGQNIYFEVAYYQPGQSLGNPPLWSKSFLIPQREEAKIRDYLDTIAVNLAAVTDERRMLAWYQDGKKIVERGRRIA